MLDIFILFDIREDLNTVVFLNLAHNTMSVPWQNVPRMYRNKLLLQVINNDERKIVLQYMDLLPSCAECNLVADSVKCRCGKYMHHNCKVTRSEIGQSSILCSTCIIHSKAGKLAWCFICRRWTTKYMGCAGCTKCNRRFHQHWRQRQTIVNQLCFKCKDKCAECANVLSGFPLSFHCDTCNCDFHEKCRSEDDFRCCRECFQTT
jgi:hypothetical protein